MLHTCVKYMYYMLTCGLYVVVLFVCVKTCLYNVLSGEGCQLGLSKGGFSDACALLARWRSVRLRRDLPRLITLKQMSNPYTPPLLIPLF